MKIGLISSNPGLSYGGTEVLIDQLEHRLTKSGHCVEKVYHSSELSNREAVIQTIYEVQKMDLGRFDMVISFRFPSYFVNHPIKLVWLLHQFRPLLDNYATEFGFPKEFSSDLLREQLIKLDRSVLGTLDNRLRVNSKITSSRLLDTAGIDASILHCPLSQKFGPVEEDTRPREVSVEKFIFAGGRISPEKRQHLAVYAGRESKVHVVLAGSPENEWWLKELKQSTNSEYVTIIDRRVTVNELSWLYRNSIGVFYGPLNEDSYGFVSGESCFFGKKFITLVDSGDVTQLSEYMNFQAVEPNYYEVARAFKSLSSLDVDQFESREIMKKWSSFSNSWEDVNSWITNSVS